MRNLQYPFRTTAEGTHSIHHAPSDHPRQDRAQSATSLPDNCGRSAQHSPCSFRPSTARPCAICNISSGQLRKERTAFTMLLQTIHGKTVRYLQYPFRTTAEGTYDINNHSSRHLRRINSKNAAPSTRGCRIFLGEKPHFMDKFYK